MSNAVIIPIIPMANPLIAPSIAPISMARAVPKSLCESGSEHEKNVRRPRAEAVVPRKGLSEAFVCIVIIFLGTKFSDFRAKQTGLIVISGSNSLVHDWQKSHDYIKGIAR